LGVALGVMELNAVDGIVSSFNICKRCQNISQPPTQLQLLGSTSKWYKVRSIFVSGTMLSLCRLTMWNP